MHSVARWVGLGAGLVAVGAAAVMASGGGDDEPEEPVATVFVGDSITRGVSPTTQLPSADESWVTYAVADPRSPWSLDANAGVFGDTLEQMGQRFQSSVVDGGAEGVVILGGTNDVLQGLPTSQSVAALRRMVEVAQQAGIEVWVVAPPPIESGYGRSPVELVEAERELAEELDVAFVDPTAELADDTGAWHEGLTFDGVHLTQEGARRLADAVLDEVSAPGSG